jgi:hypothetical protein
MDNFQLDGRCTCGALRYRMCSSPMFVHCCHCRWCQRESGASFALNAMIEADRVKLLAGTPEIVVTPSQSGKGQKIARCPICHVAVWSHYAGAGDAVCFARVGTLDDPDRLPYFRVLEAAVGGAPRLYTSRRRVLLRQGLLARGEPDKTKGVASQAAKIGGFGSGCFWSTETGSEAVRLSRSKGG